MTSDSKTVECHRGGTSSEVDDVDLDSIIGDGARSRGENQELAQLHQYAY